MKAERKSRVDAPFLGAKGGTLHVIVAPTGYGKTSAVHYAWRRVSRRWGRVVHVLPMRAIVYDAAARAVERGVPSSDVSYYAAIYDVLKGEDGVARRSPYMLSRYTVVPFDIYSFTFYVAPAADLSRVYAHGDVGLYLAAAGGVFFDEAHLVPATDECEDAEKENRKVYTMLYHEIHVLSRFLQRPVVYATSALPAKQAMELLDLDGVETKIHVYLGREGVQYYKMAGIPIIDHGLDPDFAAHYEKYRKCVKTVGSRDDLEDDVRKVVKEMDRVVVFCNTVARAVRIYEVVKPDARAETILVHSRFTEKDLREKIERIRKLLDAGERVLVVSTQVLEAGTDLDFDAVVTEVASPGALIQRAGKAFRNLEKRGEDEKGLILVNVSEESRRSASAVYGDVTDLAKYLAKVPEQFDWRFAEGVPCFFHLFFVAREQPRMDRSIYASLTDVMWPRLIGRTTDAVKRMDRWVKEVFPRDAALIPIIDEGGAVMASMNYVKKRARYALDLKNGVKIVFNDKETGVSPHWFNEEPLTVFYYLRNERSEVQQLLGLQAARKVYSDEEGFP